jgi:hypothetical protein
MRTRAETIRTLRDLQMSCLNRGFYGGRAFETKGDKEALNQARKEAEEESLAQVDLLQAEITELYQLVHDLGGDLLCQP